MSEEKVLKEGDLNLWEEERDLIMRGERPQDMPREIFKQVRKDMQNRIRAYQKAGKMAWVSTHWIQMSDEELEKQRKELDSSGVKYEPGTKEWERTQYLEKVQNVGRGTYRRATPRRHEELGRK